MFRLKFVLFSMAALWTAMDNHQVFAAPTSVPDNTTNDLLSAAGSAISSTPQLLAGSLQPNSSNTATQDASQGTESTKNAGTQAIITTPSIAPSVRITMTSLQTTSVHLTAPSSRDTPPMRSSSSATFHTITVSQPTDGQSTPVTSGEFPWQGVRRRRTKVTEVTFGLAALSGALLILCVAVCIVACKIKGKLKNVHKTLYPVTVDNEHVYQDLQPARKSNDRVELTAITRTGEEEIDSPTFSPSSPPIPFSRNTRTSSGENHSPSSGRVTLHLAPEPPIQPPPRRISASNQQQSITRGNDKKQQKNKSNSISASYVNEAFSTEKGKLNKRSMKRASKKSQDSDQSVTGLYDNDDDDSCIYEDYEHNEGYDIGMIDDVLVENAGANISQANTEGGVILRKPLVGNESHIAFTHTELTERQTSLSGLPDMAIHRSSSKEQFKNSFEAERNSRISDGIPGNDLNDGILAIALSDTNNPEDLMDYDDADVLPTPDKLIEHTDTNTRTSFPTDADKAAERHGTDKSGEIQNSMDSLVVYDDADVDMDSLDKDLPLYEDYAITTETKNTADIGDSSVKDDTDIRPISVDNEDESKPMTFTNKVANDVEDKQACNEADGYADNKALSHLSKPNDNEIRQLPGDVDDASDLLGFPTVSQPQNPDMGSSSGNGDPKQITCDTGNQDVNGADLSFSFGKVTDGLSYDHGDSFQDLNQIATIPIAVPTVPPRRDLLVQPQGSIVALEHDVLNTNNVSGNGQPVSISNETEQHSHNDVPLHLDLDEVQMRPGRKMSELETPSPRVDYFLDMDDIPSELSERAQRRISVHKRRSDEICLTNVTEPSSGLMDLLGNGFTLDRADQLPAGLTSFPIKDNSLTGPAEPASQNGGFSNGNGEEPLVNLMDEDIYDTPPAFQQ